LNKLIKRSNYGTFSRRILSISSKRLRLQEYSARTGTSNPKSELAL